MFLFHAAPAAQTVTDPSQIVQFFQQGSQQWEPLITRAANWIFYTLAGIDLVWTFLTSVGQTRSIEDAWHQTWPRMLGLLFWFNMIRLGLPWLTAIPSSFVQLGHMASTAQATTPSGILSDGFNVADQLFTHAFDAGEGYDLLTSMGVAVAGWLIILAYFVVCAHFMLAEIEMWVSLRSAFLFVGFAGSRWTEPYAERYITLLISTGFRLFMLELFVGFGHQFATQWWTPAAQRAPYNQAGVEAAWMVAAEAMLFAVICWQAPAKIAGILSASPALSAGSITSFVAPLVQSGIAGITMIYSSVSSSVAQGARAATATMGAAASSGAPPQPAPALPQNGSSGPPQPKPRSTP
jgi:type IV secretion system protein TrbL